MLDSFFKIPSGVLDGDIIWPGQYDECIKINQAFNDRLTYNTTFLIHGKYFLAGLQIPVDLVSNNSFRTNSNFCGVCSLVFPFISFDNRVTVLDNSEWFDIHVHGDMRIMLSNTDHSGKVI